MGGVAARSCTAGHRHAPGIKEISPGTLALPKVLQGTQGDAHYLHLIPTRAVTGTKLVLLHMLRGFRTFPLCQIFSPQSSLMYKTSSP